MPLPILALAGLGAVTAFFQSVFKSAIEFFFTKAFKRLVYFGVFVTAIFLAINVLYGKLSGYLSAVLAGMPPEIQMLGYILPANTGECIGAVIGFEVAALVYTFAMKTINIKMAAVN